MLEKSFGLLFYLKTARSEKKSGRVVYLRITVDGISKVLSTKRVWTEDRWDQKAGRAIGNKEDARILNMYLESVSSLVYHGKSQLLDCKKQITAEALMNIVLGIGDSTKWLLEIFREHNDRMKALVGKEFAPATLTRYITSHDHTKNFIKWKYGKDDIALEDLNYEFVIDYAHWLKTARKCAHNSTVKYISNLKKIILQCIKKGWLRSDPFIEFKTTRKEVDRIALTKEEVDRIKGKRLEQERLDVVRDIFLFSCYTGLAYIDVRNLTHKHIVQGIDGELWMMTSRQKTNTPTRLPLLPFAVEILNKYKNNPKCENSGLALPVLTNQKMNSYLKEIGDVCQIDKELTFHIARHTFATTITLSNGVPIETVSKMLGHKSLKQTQHYAKIVDLKISEDMSKLKSRLRLS